MLQNETEHPNCHGMYFAFYCVKWALHKRNLSFQNSVSPGERDKYRTRSPADVEQDVKRRKEDKLGHVSNWIKTNSLSRPPSGTFFLPWIGLFKIPSNPYFTHRSQQVSSIFTQSRISSTFWTLFFLLCVISKEKNIFISEISLIFVYSDIVCIGCSNCTNTSKRIPAYDI